METKRKSAYVRGHRRQDHFGKAFDGLDRGKQLIRDAVDNTVHFKLTHAESIAMFNKLREADWYKRLPNWAKSHLQGYEDAVRRGWYSPIERALKSMSLYKGILYGDYDGWRKANPTGNAWEMVSVSVWDMGDGKGKVHFASTQDEGNVEGQAMQGQEFPIYMKGKE